MSLIKYNFGVSLIFYILLSVILSKNRVFGNTTNSIQLQSQWKNLSLPKELISNTISLIYRQSTLMIMSSERDFSFNISSNRTLNYIRYPQSYRATLLQASSNMYDVLFNTYSTMYRMQLSMKQIPNHIKTISRLILVGSSTMTENMLPKIMKNIMRIFHDNENFMIQIIEQFNNLFKLLYEIKQVPRDLSLKPYRYPSNKTDLILYNNFNSKDVLKRICLTTQQIQMQLKEIVQLLTKFDLSHTDDRSCFISSLYTIENNAYFLYELSSIYADVLDRSVLDQTTGMGRYVTLPTDEERLATLSTLSQKVSNIFAEVEKIFRDRQDEFETSNRVLREVYEKLFHQFQNRSSTSKN